MIEIQISLIVSILLLSTSIIISFFTIRSIIINLRRGYVNSVWLVDLVFGVSFTIPLTIIGLHLGGIIKIVL